MIGGCLCGAVRYECTGEPVFALLCHCRDCQRQSGSAYAAGWRVPAAGFRVTQGEPKLFVKSADSGNVITRAFCPDCGSMLFLQVSARPDLVAIRVGTLDDPSGFRPVADIFVKSAQPWDYMKPDLPKYPTYPPGQAYEPAAPHPSLPRERGRVREGAGQEPGAGLRSGSGRCSASRKRGRARSAAQRGAGRAYLPRR